MDSLSEPKVALPSNEYRLGCFAIPTISDSEIESVLSISGFLMFLLELENNAKKIFVTIGLVNAEIFAMNLKTSLIKKIKKLFLQNIRHKQTIPIKTIPGSNNNQPRMATCINEDTVVSVSEYRMSNHPKKAAVYPMKESLRVRKGICAWLRGTPANQLAAVTKMANGVSNCNHCKGFMLFPYLGLDLHV